jgi:hypothetical protein
LATKPNIYGHDLYEGSPAWAAPMEGRVKANVDAGYDILSNKAGIGIFICYHTWKPVVSE